MKQTLIDEAIDACYFLSKSLYLSKRAIHHNLVLTNHLHDAVNRLRIACDESVWMSDVVRLLNTMRQHDLQKLAIRNTRNVFRVV